MRIGLDCRLSGPTHAGIGRYIENLLIRLPVMAPDIEWVYLFDNDVQYQDIVSRVVKQYDVALEKVERVYIPIRHYTLEEQTKLPGIVSGLNLDLLHTPHFNIPMMYQGKLAVTIHDLLWHQQKGTNVTTLSPWLYWTKYAGYRFVVARAVEKADVIFVPTDSIKGTLAQYYPKVQSKVVVTNEGIDDRLLRYKQIQPKRLENTLVYVGSLYPHKNVKFVIEALKYLPEWKLVIIGARSVFLENVKEYAKKAKVHKRVTFTGYLSDTELANNIQTATALVQPSLSEGFGLTGVEAMALGTPLLASNIPTFTEIYQDSAIYFDPQSIDEFIAATQKVTQLDVETWRTQAAKVVAQYSWDKMARETIAEYRKIIQPQV